MAAGAAHQLGLVQQTQGDPIQKWGRSPLFDDTPTEDGMLHLGTAKAFLYQQAAGGSTLGANVEGTDPGAGGGGNAIVQAQHADRCSRSHQALLSMIDISSNLYSICSAPPFVNGEQVWVYLNSANIVYSSSRR